MFASVTVVGLIPRKGRQALQTALLGLLLAGGPALAGDLSGSCRVADQPAATLLIPYFEVELDDADGATTLISVNNGGSRSTAARVVLWTDWGVPTLAFDIYLTGYDVQTLNLRDLFATGSLPVTGTRVSHVGALSTPAAQPKSSGCETAGVPRLNAAERQYLRAAHTGQPVEAGRCAGSGKGGRNLATGYITVDTVNRCSARTLGATRNTPADPAYFADGGTGLASNSNALWGDYFYMNRRRGQADSQSAVHIVADADAFGPGDYTFYGRYNEFDSRDNRAPLSSLYYARFIKGGAFFGETSMVVWRDNRQSGGALSECGRNPSWAPLGEYQLVAFDEEENPSAFPNSNAFPVSTQKVKVGSPALPVTGNAGWLMIDLWHRDESHAQGWVSILMKGEGGRFSVGHQAVRADDLCNFGL